MKTSPIFLLLCVWAAHAYASTLGSQSLQRSSATLRLGTARSSSAPLRLQVDAFNQRHSLRLQPAPTPFAKGFRLQITSRDEQGRVIIEDIAHDKDDNASDLYEDREGGSVVRLTAAGVEGFISPSLALNTAADGKHEAVRQNYELEPVQHVSDYLQVPEEVRSKYSSTTTSRAETSATVEMYIVVDSTLTAKLGSSTNVKNYLGVFWNAVNLRFATMTDPKIKLVLAGALIVSDSSDETYINDNILTQNYINGDNTLESLSKWAFEKRDSLPPHDMVYLMTGKDMASVEDGAIQKGLAGIAWLSAACVVAPSNSKSYNTAMGEDSALYTGVMTAAHEVAHNLGAPHDGSGDAASCSWNDGFLMSYIQGNSNKLLFSSCSQSLMKAYVSSNSAACLHTDTATSQITLSSTLPGEKVSMDQQCQAATGQSGAYASTSVSENSLCYLLVCQWKQQEGYYIYTYTQSTGEPAAEGSPCKSGGKCKNGSCQ
ncbi:Venom metalloproteinase antarease-like protein [Portunus trituberculatus]|uniref:Venom metalloproteinase antarease-like protein n=1 Tax=Portunus trituberculatus TaxID=210409 RepID=A0A5B7HH49_PORTR|nr:Venom metalloproteinase antarease-like protein [Portunus trituberculatus]